MVQEREAKPYELLKQIRKDRGLTQDKIGYALGFQNGDQIGAWERNKRLPNREHLLGIIGFYMKLDAENEYSQGPLMILETANQLLQGYGHQEIKYEAPLLWEKLIRIKSIVSSEEQYADFPVRIPRKEGETLECYEERKEKLKRLILDNEMTILSM